MPDSKAAMACVQKFWDAVNTRNFDACEATMSPDIVRIGPQLQSEQDIARGRKAYGDFIRKVISAMPSYHNVTHELVATPDGKRVYIHCTEWSAPGAGSSTEVEVPLVMICHIDDNTQISKIDLYWKTPKVSVGWTEAAKIAAS